MEDYLEMINMLGGDNVRSVDIATHMHVSKASVNRAVNVLIEKGLVH
ncbi:MAG TPA: MarR family transcriptional regulator, partial [Bacillota bacterium]|nr:MarR family transcriptional regulator [Bacillota bacterium]